MKDSREFFRHNSTKFSLVFLRTEKSMSPVSSQISMILRLAGALMSPEVMAQNSGVSNYKEVIREIGLLPSIVCRLKMSRLSGWLM